jgi:methenyltetrahydrofolate cyclohydrolase
VRELHGELAPARDALHRLVQEDAHAYLEVMAALKLPKESPEEKAARAEALKRATRTATDVPLRTARLTCQVLEMLGVLAEIGNSNARSDAAAGAQLAFAALKAAQYNVLINLPGLGDSTFGEACRNEASELASRGHDVLQKVDMLMMQAE